MKWDDDYYTRKARREGYPARSVYKLMEIQRKYRVVSRGDRVLDLGAAPGSWSKYLLSCVGEKGLVVAVDLLPLVIGSHERLVFYQGDFTSDEVQERIDVHAPFQVIVSDAAPSTSGNRGLDTARSEALVERILSLAGRWLVPGGNLVAKLFQGSGAQEIFRAVREGWERAYFFRPQATRRQSFEVFVVGVGKRS
ncbi:Ribosomal RNA large subunit methyltransferase E [Spirochaeta thermophila DSM 6578]|uniref:Ribosomal RNA large subunit methyltransferase E n=1 Tax=Winmispira thermophila (strain ATCC 700085 / DSM 6578 / Z-1203) TaxID=869211 RepID=G0GFZ7_WINT7|nr:RlmE family RNA methyltransferase [Spirochaeta thermophila]AEJ62473.1 Ribosomal RNA large subunit methyltransferase E [Spirochaeta thermophila DSM 6578]